MGQQRPDNKKAYYNARKMYQTKQAANRQASKTKEAAEKAVVGVKREPSKAQKIAALKKQLKDLEK